jgi:hypothetical protein
MNTVDAGWITRICRVLLLLLTLALVGNVGRASAQDATLYELTENLKFTRGKIAHRVATSALMGFAELGTPLCPLGKSQGPCSINAVGSTNVASTTGLGTFDGRFTVVVPGDNPVDGPELVVMSGRFRGRIDFAPALVHNIPFGTVDGHFVVERSGKRIPFSGVFRLPFLGSVAVPVGVDPVTGAPVTRTLRQLLCPLTPRPNPSLGGPDIAYVDTTGGMLNGTCRDVLPSELSLGVPTVRFDIAF